jgi:DHA2 family multidrug resistance protein
VKFNQMGERVTDLNPAAQNMLQQFKQLLISSGIDPAAATERAYAMISGLVTQQAMMVAYLDTFRLYGVVFLFALPLVFLLRRPPQPGGVKPVEPAAEAAH